MPNHDRELINHAREFATKAHQNSRPYGDQPYIVHPAAVAEMLTPYGPEEVAAGWLHDTVEDTDVTLDDLRAAGFPDTVVTTVDAVTRRDGELYFDFVRRAANHDRGRIVKLADNIHNAGGLDNVPDKLWVANKKRQYRRARQILERALVLATSHLDGLVSVGSIRLCDLDMSDSPYWFFALGHPTPAAALSAFQHRAYQLSLDMPPASIDNITQGWAIWTGTVKNWAFQSVPDNTTPGAFRATWLSDL